jgi:tetratricopeptide (TPR) repeat protein
MRHASISTQLLAAVCISAGSIASSGQLLAPPSEPTVSATAGTPQPQHQLNFDAERAQADQLSQQQKLAEAMPLYADLVRQDPTVTEFAERYAAVLFNSIAGTPDLAGKLELFHKGEAELQRAQAMGDNSPFSFTLQRFINRSPLPAFAKVPQGALPPTRGYLYEGSDKARAIEAQADASFAKKDLPSALTLYLSAAAADPAWYDAAMNVSRTYAAQQDPGNAAKWLAKAIAIDPDRETAYHGWGDMLLALDKPQDARGKYELAIAAEPYNPLVWTGFARWARTAHFSLTAPLVTHPEFKVSDGQLVSDPALTHETGNGRSAWLAYEKVRVAHGATVSAQRTLAGSFAPDGTFTPAGYVHTAAEELDALHALLRDLDAKIAAGTVTEEKLDPPLKALRRIETDNLLEPFIYISFYDAGIAQGYPRYRDAHRAEIVKYVDSYLVGVVWPPVDPVQSK